MAVEFKAPHTRTSEYLFLPADIKFKPELNGRHDLPDIEGLIESMVSVGQLQPVLVRNDGGFPVLCAGFSRWRAAVEINKRGLTPEPIKLRCVYFKGSEQQAFLANLAENHRRKPATPIDDGYNIARLERYGMSIDEIATVYREDSTWVRKRLDYVSLTPESQKALKEGRVKPNATATLARMSEEEQGRAVEKADKSGKPLSRADLKPAKPKPLPPDQPLTALVKRIAEKGDAAVPFKCDLPHTVTEACKKLVRFVEGKE